jgi:hypothetical protein
VRLGGEPDPRGAQLAIRRGKDKVILGPWGHLCFDLERDPEERGPIVGAEDCGIETSAELARWNQETRRVTDALGETRPSKLDPEERERLRAIGYLD